MEHYFVHFFETHFDVLRHFGYFIVWGISLLESVPLLGMLIPGQTIVILSGFLVKAHVFGFWAITLVATLGAMMGDSIGYYLGRTYGHHFSRAEKKFFIKREQFLSTKRVIEQNAFKSIFFGRLHSLTRTITPFASGASDIGFGKFILIEFLSSFCWAFISISIGYIFGKSFEKASMFIGELVMVATLIALVIMLCVHYAKKRNIRMSKIHVYIFIASAVSLYLFLIIASDIRGGGFFNTLDQRVYILRHTISSGFWDFFSIAVTFLVNPYLRVLYFLSLLYYMFRSSKFKDMLLAFITILSGTLVVTILKGYFGRVRPHGIVDASGSSFPSGHAAISMMFAILVIYSITRHLRSAYLRSLAQWVLYGGVFVIGFSRVYLGVHYVSDVLAGFCFGVFWSTFMILLFKIERFVVRKVERDHTLPLP